MSELGKVFEYILTVQETDLDVFGHVNNAVYLKLYEEARWDFITQAGHGLERIREEKKGPVILQANVSFRRELKSRDRITITSQFLGMKHPKVMLLEQKMIKEDGQVASHLELEVGYFDMQKRKLITPTPEWFKAIGAPEDQYS